MDEGIGTRHFPEKTVGGVARAEVAGCAPANARENHQAPNGGHASKGTQGAASKNEDSHSQQAKDDQKCSGENGVIFTVTS